MKANYGKKRICCDASVELIRNLIFASADIAMIELWGFGPKRLGKLHNTLRKLADEFDAAWKDDRKGACDALREVLRSLNIDYGGRFGSGEKVMLAYEHDYAIMLYMLAMHKKYGFGKDRCAQMFRETVKTIQYTNRTFDGHPFEVLVSLRSRIRHYTGKDCYIVWREEIDRRRDDEKDQRERTHNLEAPKNDLERIGEANGIYTSYSERQAIRSIAVKSSGHRNDG